MTVEPEAPPCVEQGMADKVTKVALILVLAVCAVMARFSDGFIVPPMRPEAGSPLRAPATKLTMTPAPSPPILNYQLGDCYTSTGTECPLSGVFYCPDPTHLRTTVEFHHHDEEGNLLQEQSSSGGKSPTQSNPKAP